MPLEACLAAGHDIGFDGGWASAFASDAFGGDHPHYHDGYLLPLRAESRRLRPAGFFGGREGAENGSAGDPMAALVGPPKQAMVIGSVRLPDRTLVDELAGVCKFDIANGTLGGGSSKPASVLGHAVSTASLCTETAGNVVLQRFLGNLLDPAAKVDASSKDGAVQLQNSMQVPLGSLKRKQLEATKDACHDFSNVLINRLSTQGDHAARKAVISAKDASHVLRSFGRCLEGIGETAAEEGCDLGRLSETSAENAALCQKVNGPDGYKIPCTVQ